MRAVFWGSALFIAYVYVGYAALLVLWAQVMRPDKAGRHDARSG